MTDPHTIPDEQLAARVRVRTVIIPPADDRHDPVVREEPSGNIRPLTDAERDQWHMSLEQAAQVRRTTDATAAAMKGSKPCRCGLGDECGPNNCDFGHGPNTGDMP
jgi:hypothetical protein